MSFNIFGRVFRFSTWGESHGPALGALVDGCPPGLALSEADIQPFLDKRRPGTSRFTTQRQEPDAVRILSGVFEGRTTGTPISLMIEDGKLNNAKDRMMRAQERLAEAIRKGASPEEIQKLMDEMRDALDEYMAEEAKKNPADPNDETSPQQKGPSITQDQIDQMLDKLQKLMEEGKTAEAAELMKQLQDLMNNMKVQQGDGTGGKGSPGKQAMKDLGNTLRGQQSLSDDSFRDLQDGQQ
ncbi:MAG: hypothetical protein B7Y00_02705, partial [Sphingomonadales bacterium 17-56-6]